MQLKQKKIKMISLGISIIGITVSIYLVIMDIITGAFCPIFLFVPACYIVLSTFVLILIGILKKQKKTSFVGITFGIMLGIYYSLLEMIQGQVCPRILNIPLCFVSLITFVLLGYLEWFKKED